MRQLGPRDRRRGNNSGSLESWLHLDLQVLAMQTQTGVSLVPSRPVSPEKRSRADREGMKQDAHLARLGRRAPAPLALLTQGTRTAIANTGPIDHTEAPVGSLAEFRGEERAPSGATQGPMR